MRILGLLLLWLAGCVSAQNAKVKFLNDDGVYLYSQGDYQNARENFAHALELSPRDPSLLFNLAQCDDRLGEFRRAEANYVECLQWNANHQEARYSLGQLYYKTGKKAELDRLIQEWLEQQPGQAYPLVLEGWRLRQEKAYPDSQARLQQALALEPHNPVALAELGVLYENLEMPERSRTLYERSLIRNPRQPEVAERLELLKTKNVGRPLPSQ